MNNKIALYRKYRPNDFDQVYGQNVIVKALENAIKNNEITHSYIFAGNKGSGKTTLAKIFSKAINCLNLQNEYNPCNQCKNCLAINNNTTSDFIELDAASNNGVNEIRNIIDTVKYFPIDLKYKIYIIDEAHMLTSSSWNALLKTIEEPPAYVVFIFATTEYYKIPSTIISRCQRYDFNKISLEELKKIIDMVATKEQIEISKNSKDIIAKISDGAARDALSILDQLVNYTNKKITEETICELFGILNIDNKIKFLNLIFENKEQEILNQINDFYLKGINFEIFINDLLNILMDKIIYLRTQNEKTLSIINKKELDNILFNKQDILIKIIEILLETAKDIKYSINQKFSLEFAVIKICRLLNNEVNDVNENINISNNSNNLIYNNEHNDILKNDLFFTKDITDKYLKKNENEINKWKIIANNNQQNKTNDSNKNNQLETANINAINVKESKHFINITNTIKEYNDEFKQNFFSIAVHENNELKKKYNQILDSLKDISSIYDAEINLLLDANKFLLVSENGAILLFETKSKAMRFNNLHNNQAINKFFIEKFGSEKLLLAIDKKQVLIYKEEFKKINKNDFKDVKIIKNQDTTKTKLLEILNSNNSEE